MTEATGGSDVGLSLTRAELREGTWRLYGRKWFTSAATSQMALTLARPEGNGPGGSGLALFYVETRDEQGRLNGIAVERLKDKLGTLVAGVGSLPTAPRPAPASDLATVANALVQMGYRNAEAERAVASLTETENKPVPELLREALVALS